MLVNAAQMLKDAEAGHYALGAFNTNNLECCLLYTSPSPRDS